ncbi:MAG: thiolase domain-containing protein [Anaerolineae bacterium]|nr:thiolase domain-containing protein [Anaerolineae bacterium]
MREVSIIGVGQFPVGEHWEKSIRELAYEAIRDAVADAGVENFGALYISNMISGQVTGQMHIGAHIADFCGYRGIESHLIEAACASGGAAIRAGVLAIASGAHDVVVVCGVEKMMDTISDRVLRALATAADAEYEVDQGATFSAINALAMKRYQHEFKVPNDAFAPFSMNAHSNAVHNPNAMFRFPISKERYLKAPMVAPPICVMDSSPICDGAAAVVLCASELASKYSRKPIRIIGSASATDSIALHDRFDMLEMRGVTLSAQRAYQQAGIKPEDVDVFELHDAFSIMATLSLEASGFAERGQGYRLALDGEIAPDKRVPICTRGGLKARGHPVGATGVYQVVEVAQQLRGEAGETQVADAKIGMAQNIGGSGATVVTHILSV